MPQALVLVQGFCTGDGVEHQHFDAGSQPWVLGLVLRAGAGDGTGYRP